MTKTSLTESMWDYWQRFWTRQIWGRWSISRRVGNTCRCLDHVLPRRNSSALHRCGDNKCYCQVVGRTMRIFGACGNLWMPNEFPGDLSWRNRKQSDIQRQSCSRSISEWHYGKQTFYKNLSSTFVPRSWYSALTLSRSLRRLGNALGKVKYLRQQS